MELLLVDEQDRVIGYGEKMDTHRKALLHRAFSVFMVRPDGRILIQQRALGKYHSGGLWSNSCCSHQYREDSLESAVSRCLWDELGIPKECQRGSLQEAGCFRYLAPLGEMTEHEIDHVVRYEVEMEEANLVKLNREEAQAARWMTQDEIDTELQADRSAYTAWFEQAYQLFKENIALKN